MNHLKHNIWFCYLILVLVIFLISGKCANGQCIELSFDTYRVNYDTVITSPVRVSWTLCPADISKSVVRSFSHFAPILLPDGRVITERNYVGNGYDKGHLCPSADRSRSVAVNRSTFTMANVCPQAPALNRGAWKKMEERCRRYARNVAPIRIVADVVWCLADTTYIGADRLPVPHAFVKTVRDMRTDTIVFSQLFINQ